MKKATLLFTILILTFITLKAQDSVGYEYQKKITKEKFHSKSIQFLQPILAQSTRERFYKNYDGQQYFYELKSKLKGEKVSIKFTEEGDLVDLRLLIEIDQLPKDIQKIIDMYFDQEFKKYKYKMAQVKFAKKPSKEEIEDDALISEFLQKDIKHFVREFNLNVRVFAKDPEQSGYFVFRFDSEGNYLSKRIIKERGLDHMLY